MPSSASTFVSVIYNELPPRNSPLTDPAVQNLYLLLGYQSVSGQKLNNPIAKILPLINAADAQAAFVANRQQTPTGNAPSSVLPAPVPVTNTPNPAGSGSSASAAKAGSALEALDVQNKASTSDNDLNLPTGSLGDKVRVPRAPRCTTVDLMCAHSYDTVSPLSFLGRSSLGSS